MAKKFFRCLRTRPTNPSSFSWLLSSPKVRSEIKGQTVSCLKTNVFSNRSLQPMLCWKKDVWINMSRVTRRGTLLRSTSFCVAAGRSYACQYEMPVWFSWNKKWHHSAKKEDTSLKFLLSVFHNNTNQVASNLSLKMSLVSRCLWRRSNTLYEIVLTPAGTWKLLKFSASFTVLSS